MRKEFPGGVEEDKRPEVVENSTGESVVLNHFSDKYRGAAARQYYVEQQMENDPTFNNGESESRSFKSGAPRLEDDPNRYDLAMKQSRSAHKARRASRNVKRGGYESGRSRTSWYNDSW